MNEAATHLQSNPREVLIIGAGLAGLSCAVHLRENGIPSTILEAADGVGGRIRTDRVEGFQLDRGFQVLLTAYPELEDIIDVDALSLQAFAPGALVRFQGGFHPVSDPFRRPAQALPTLLGPIGSLADKLRIALLRQRCRRGTANDQLAGPDTTTLAYLQANGLGPSIIERFFRPFLGGIFLDRSLSTSSRMFRFVFRMFAEGAVALPAAGMEALPSQLAARLPARSIRLGTPVTDVSPGRVVLGSGEVIPGSRIVIATDGATASRWVDSIREPAWCPVQCLYYAAPRAPITDPTLILNGDGEGPINNVCFPTQVAPSYGPGEESLASVTVIGNEWDQGNDLESLVKDQLAAWFGDEVDSWRHLRTYRISRALPRQNPGWLDPAERSVRVGEGLYLAGDHRDTASTNGALRAGRRAAAAVHTDLGGP